MNVLDLFSGIGGFSLGLERAGMRTVAFCEIDPYCRAVLVKHWPHVKQYDDVRTLTAERLRADGISVDVICGGFPCQDISNAGQRAGIDGERSGLWSEYARLIGELRPRFVIVENVAALLGRGLDRVLGDLAAFGFDAEWHCIPASAVGAPHRRDRIWIMAHATGERCERERRRREMGVTERRQDVADTAGLRWNEGRAHPDRVCLEAGGHGLSEFGGTSAALADPKSGGCPPDVFGGAAYTPKFDPWWAVEPDVGRVAHGVPARVDRLRALGNAVVPQIPEIIGRAIMRAEGLSP